MPEWFVNPTTFQLIGGLLGVVLILYFLVKLVKVIRNGGVAIVQPIILPERFYEVQSEFLAELKRNTEAIGLTAKMVKSNRRKVNIIHKDLCAHDKRVDGRITRAIKRESKPKRRSS